MTAKSREGLTVGIVVFLVAGATGVADVELSALWRPANELVLLSIAFILLGAVPFLVTKIKGTSDRLLRTDLHHFFSVCPLFSTSLALYFE